MLAKLSKYYPASYLNLYLPISKQNGACEVTSHPNLSSGVAGWLKQMSAAGKQYVVNYYLDAYKVISDRFIWTTENEYTLANLPWGIYWVKQNHPDWLNPRLLNY